MIHHRKAAILVAMFSVTAFAQQPTAETADELFRAQKWGEAAEAYAKLAEAEPRNGLAWHRLGYSLHISGKLEEALFAHLKAAEIPQVRANGLYNAACACALLGRKADALKYLEKAVDAGLRNTQQIQSDDDLASIRNDEQYARIVAKAGRDAVPAKASVAAREFNFWIGNWEVRNQAGVKVGNNVITARQDGAILYESWTSANGNTGESFNFYDPKAKKWRQIWVTPAGGVAECAGTFFDGAMRMTGWRTGPDGTTAKTKSVYTPLPDGRVRQFIEESTDDGQTWTTYFDGFYVKLEDAITRPAERS